MLPVSHRLLSDEPLVALVSPVMRWPAAGR
ncbi:Uncharacterised protein [Serratia rubidaea]|uniref:Uncharacterized protein n=1 Tax=Serratia rubidaea TaxID=61652 RepID=A0A3S4FV72_SERRU|nr:Uncharacterised protein [Serratia rubidaea]